MCIGEHGVKLLVLDARAATDHFPGIGRYISNLARSMAPLLSQGELLILLRDSGRASRYQLNALDGERVRVIETPVSPFSIRQQWLIRGWLQRLHADVYHSPYFLMPFAPGVPTILTVYDFIPTLHPEYVSRRVRLISRWATALALRAADHVIAISQQTQEDLQETAKGLGSSFGGVLQGRAKRVTVVPLAPDAGFQLQSSAAVEDVRQRYGLPISYALYLGRHKAHKNVLRLVEAWRILMDHFKGDRNLPVLVMAGEQDPGTRPARRRAEELELGEHARFLGLVPDEDLPGLYAGSRFFVFPSLQEGFGLPVLEAMACGTPACCSAIASLREVAGEAALYFDPAQAGSIAGAVGALHSDPALRDDLRVRGLRQVSKFSWAQTAHQTLQIYRDLTG